MRKLIPLKLSSWLLLAVLLAVTVNYVVGSAHAAECHVSSAGGLSLSASAPDHSPCFPLEQHNDCDDCDSCCDCACHAPLIMQPFQLNYRPSIAELHLFDPFKYLPEVYLSKFIPPQNLA